MKDQAKKLIVLPALKIGILLLAFGIFISPASILANDSEEELVLESWMAVPFDQALEESELSFENWMAVPFDQALEESELTFETWMAESWL